MLGDADNEMNFVMRVLNEANTTATFTLSIQSHRCDLLSVQCGKEAFVRPITQPHFLEQQELLASAHTHGAKFFATSGSHATTGDFFKAIEIPKWNAEIKTMVDKKANLALFEKIEREGKTVLTLNKPISGLFNKELGTLLLWNKKDLKSSQGKKSARISKWRAIIAAGTLPPVNEKWSPGNEAKLERLRKKGVTMGDTEYGRLLAQKKKEITAALGKSNKAEMVEWKVKIDLIDAAKAGEDGEERAA